MPSQTLRQVITGQTLVTARRDTSVRAAAVADGQPVRRRHPWWWTTAAG